jgi:EAL domain-containing protein (putative c-di-GMP-specific phosphodiesterase class I)/FixJ family two-component response regulator/GGDEF domain-containing protein
MMTHSDKDDDLPAIRHKLERLNRLYAMLSRINRSIVRAEDPYVLYEAACQIAVEHGAFGLAWIVLVEPAIRRVAAVAHAGTAVDKERLLATDADAPGDPCPAVTAIREDRVCVVNDLAGDGHRTVWRSSLAEAGLWGAAAFPLRLEGHVVGVFMVASGEPEYFKEAEVRLLEEVADDISFALGVMRREEKHIAAETKARYLAYYDSQTGLPGRVRFEERLAAACEVADDRTVAVLAVNLRRYHGVLQVLGQAAGAHLARSMATRLEALLPTSAVGRITESEFATFLAVAPDRLDLVEETAWSIHAALAQTIPANGREIFVDPFIGIALYPKDGAAADALNAALMAATTGAVDATSICRFYVADMDRHSRGKLDLEEALRRALEREEFVLYYQPQVDLASGRVVGAEALLRWQRPDCGLVPPLDFIPLLEETGLIVPVGEWVMQEACRRAKGWQDEGLAPLRMAVNLSARQFQDTDVAAMVLHALDASGLEPCWLELEITEGIVLLNAEAVIGTMNQLKAHGVSHALDDFGTGYSSLSYLQRLPVAHIKIDQSFVANITADPNDAAIVRAVVGMAHSLGMSVIAEGVETEGQLGYLRGLQCEEMQGYYFSRPLPPDAFAALLREGRGLAPAVVAQKPERVLLLLDDEPNVLASLRRLLRRTEFRVLATTSPKEAFELMAANPVGVVVCDQRMPEMTGTEFLRRVKELHPGAVRIVLSGYTDLNSVIDAVNRGAIYKFLTKPWEDDVLLTSLHDAFRLHEMERDNRVLSMQVKELLAAAAARQ